MKRSLTLAGLVLAPFLLFACGDDDPESSSTAGTTSDSASFPVTVGGGKSAVKIESKPEQIVSLSPTATEMLFAMGAGDQVVAADQYSNYPKDAPTTDLDAFQPNVEAVIDYEPDLVIASYDPSDLVASLDKVGVPTLMLPAAVTLDDSYTQIEQLGIATGHVGEAGEVVSQMQSDIESIVADAPDGAPVTYFHELDANLYTVTGSTFIGQLYEMAGMRSIADDAPDAAGDYPQLSPEYVVSSDPDLIFLADGGSNGGVTADELANRPGWDQLTAVQNDHVTEVDPDIASRWGPRVVDYLQTLVDARSELQPVG
jgi:iron complex transport system substrate-binding protein